MPLQDTDPTPSFGGFGLMGDYVIPAVREIGDELELKGPFEISPWTNEPMAESNGAPVALQ